MGRLVVEQIVSVDGTAVDADGGMGFVPEPPGDGAGEGAIDDEQVARFADLRAIVLGAHTYRMFAEYWPGVTADQEPIAALMNTLPKHVVSSTLDAAPWGDHPPATVERGDGVEVLRRLKADVGDGEAVLWGSLTLADAAFAAGEVDVLRLRVVPTLTGGGRGVVPASLAPTPLRLVSCHAHAGGQVALEYALAR